MRAPSNIHSLAARSPRVKLLGGPPDKNASNCVGHLHPTVHDAPSRQGSIAASRRLPARTRKRSENFRHPHPSRRTGGSRDGGSFTRAFPSRGVEPAPVVRRKSPLQPSCLTRLSCQSENHLLIEVSVSVSDRAPSPASLPTIPCSSTIPASSSPSPPSSASCSSESPSSRSSTLRYCAPSGSRRSYSPTCSPSRWPPRSPRRPSSRLASTRCPSSG